MSQGIQLTPAKWVAEDILMGITGMKKNTIKTAREKSWMEGREYRHVSPDGCPRDNSMCMYNWREIERWVDMMPAAIPRRKTA
ncbi:excisionase family protein [Ewingella americana]|jgi:hypothetical protein